MTQLRKTLSASTLTGDGVVNPSGENLGKLEELMLHLDTGAIAYAVMSFGGFLGIGDKLFAIPWGSVIVLPKERLENAPGFDKHDWPDCSSVQQRQEIDDYHR